MLENRKNESHTKANSCTGGKRLQLQAYKITRLQAV
jgi:hypothetical protein